MVVDSGAGLVTTSKCLETVLYLYVRFTYHYGVVNTANGDITSMKFNGKELQDSSKFTQLSSGLGKTSEMHVHSRKTNSLYRLSHRHFLFGR